MNCNNTEATASDSSTPPTPSTDRLYSPISGGDSWPSLQSHTTEEAFQTVLKNRRSWKILRGGEAVWPLDLEAALLEGLENYAPDDSRETRILGRFPRRNRFISDYIFEKTGKRRSAKQVGSRLQQLRECCGSKKLLDLLSPCRQPTYPESSASSDSSLASSPVSPLMDQRMLSGTSSLRPTVMYIGILPEGAPDQESLSKPPSRSNGENVMHASEHPRRLGSINPSVTFVSQQPIVARSRFTVYSEDLILHDETAPLVLLMDPIPQDSGFLYSTTLVPEYWKIISRSPDPTRFTILQEVAENDNSIVFSATYKFSYPSRNSPTSSPSLNTLSATNARLDIDSAASVQPTQLPGDRYPSLGVTEWDDIFISRGNSPNRGYRSPGSDPSSTSTCFPSALSNYVL
ncbi:hypothetical protein B0H10DRAFT_47716 [Mycena sp. CBHHK59/15]|nr:hypothetical protein B0H10DRAFT_47716 [Mycena sp. CBHHK59/15]